MKIKLNIEGMHCSSCAAMLESDLKELKGIKNVSASSKDNTAKIEFDDKILSEANIKSRITKLGYKTA